MPQDTYNVDPGQGQAGQLASSADHQLNSAFVDEATGVAAGLFVVRNGTDSAKASLPAAATGEDALGFAYLDPSLNSPTTWIDGEPMTYLEKGEVYAVVDAQAGTIAPGDPVHVRFDTAVSAGTIGAVAETDVDADFSTLPIANAEFVSVGTTAPDGTPIAVVKFHR